MKLKRALATTTVLLYLSTANAYADPVKEPSMTPQDEKALVIKQTNFRKAVAMAEAVEEYKTAIFAAVVEQNRYDEEQQARVAVAVEHYSEEESEEPSRRDVSSEPSSGRCGGDLPPCSVMQRESGGDIRAENPSSSASGKWQFIDGTWNNYGGYAHASDAPESVQDAKARELWADGSGCGHWSQTGGC